MYSILFSELVSSKQWQMTIGNIVGNEDKSCYLAEDAVDADWTSGVDAADVIGAIRTIPT